MKFVTVMQIILGAGVLGILAAILAAYVQAVGEERQARLTERLRGSYGPQALEDEAPVVDPARLVLLVHDEAYYVQPEELEDEPNKPYDQDLELGQ